MSSRESLGRLNTRRENGNTILNDDIFSSKYQSSRRPRQNALVRLAHHALLACKRFSAQSKLVQKLMFRLIRGEVPVVFQLPGYRRRKPKIPAKREESQSC